MLSQTSQTPPRIHISVTWEARGWGRACYSDALARTCSLAHASLWDNTLRVRASMVRQHPVLGVHWYAAPAKPESVRRDGTWMKSLQHAIPRPPVDCNGIGRRCVGVEAENWSSRGPAVRWYRKALFLRRPARCLAWCYQRRHSVDVHPAAAILVGVARMRVEKVYCEHGPVILANAPVVCMFYYVMRAAAAAAAAG